MDKPRAKPHLLQLFQNGNHIGTSVECYYNPKDPDQVILEKASQESYNKMVLDKVVWPLALVILGVVVIATAGCYFSSRSRYTYERIEGISTTSLQQTL